MALAGLIVSIIAIILAVTVEVRQRRWHTAAEAEGQISQARQVLMTLAGSGGIKVVLTNHSDQPVRLIRLDDVQFPGDATIASWRVNDKVWNARQQSSGPVAAGSNHTVPIELLAGDGSPRIHTNSTIQVTYSVLDAAGREWQRTGNGDPVRVGVRPKFIRRQVARVPVLGRKAD